MGVRLLQVSHLLSKVPGQEGAQDGGEDATAAVIRHVGHGQQVKVAQEAVGDRVAAPARGAHGSHKLSVNDLLEGTRRLPVIPTLQPKTNSTLCLQLSLNQAPWHDWSQPDARGPPNKICRSATLLYAA